MQLLTTTFDRVFDVVCPSKYWAENREPQTSFGFQNRRGRQCGVSVPGSPQITPGMTVTAVLAEADNWQSLLGWVNHDTGELTYASVGIVFVWLFITLIIVSGALIAIPNIFANIITALGGLVALGIIGKNGLNRYRAYRMLVEVKESRENS
jgi:hypothetical protein